LSCPRTHNIYFQNRLVTKFRTAVPYTRAVRLHSNPRSHSREKTRDKGTNKCTASDAWNRQQFPRKRFSRSRDLNWQSLTSKPQIWFECSFNFAGWTWFAFYCYHHAIIIKNSFMIIIFQHWSFILFMFYIKMLSYNFTLKFGWMFSRRNLYKYLIKNNI